MTQSALVKTETRDSTTVANHRLFVDMLIYKRVKLKEALAAGAVLDESDKGVLVSGDNIKPKPPVGKRTRYLLGEYVGKRYVRV